VVTWVRCFTSLQCVVLIIGNRTDHIILDNYFPLSTANLDGRSEVTDSHSVVRGPAATVINEGETDDLRPGESYTIYHSRDVLGNLPEEQALIITRSAKWVGVSDDYLCGVIERFERRLQRWYDKERRRERELQGTESEGMED
jgi:RNA polymerase I-specific transcription initiation factor RRN7